MFRFLSSFVRLSLRHALALVVVGALVFAAAEAIAQDEGRGRHRQGPFREQHAGEHAARQALRAQRAQQMEAQRGQREALRNQREERQAPPVLAPPAPQPVEQPRDARPGRLSPDERRALRQQINDANRDVYRFGRP